MSTAPVRKGNQRAIYSKFRKAYNYLYSQVRVSLPSETKRNNRDVDLCLVVAGAHKVGSTWVYKMIKDLHIFRELPLPPRYRSDVGNYSLIGLDRPGIEEYFERRSGLRIYKSHSPPPSWDPGSKVRFITVIRDPRDVVISNIYYLANLPLHLGGWPEMRNLPTSERIARYLDRGVFDLKLLEAWSVFPPAMKVYYEKLLESPEAEMMRVLRDAGLKISESECCAIVRNNSFNRLSGGRKKGQENSGSFFRKGVAGDWKNHFGEKEIECFKNEHDGAWNRLLMSLGYEQGENWS